MRPVNLIPPDERRGDAAALRTGALIYVLVGGLAVFVLGIAVVALTGKQINDRKSEKASLEQELQQETARANSLAAFTNFRTIQENRAATLTSLAQSRFDWTRVLQELSLVLPSDVTISSLTGTVSPDVNLQSSGGSSSTAGGTDLRAGIEKPALDITGCAPGQDAVASLVSALEDIDGVTRVGLDSSKIDTESSSSSGSSSSGGTASGGGSTECFAGPDTSQFHIVVAFDAAPTPGGATAAPSVPSVPPTSSDQVGDAQQTGAVGQAQDQATVSRAQSAVASTGTGG
jgi:Tfp pilus assembly protein PilN